MDTHQPRIVADPPSSCGGPTVNDLHSLLNETRVARIVVPPSEEEVRRTVLAARAERLAVAITGGRHAMGGQQFATDGILLDTTRLDRVLDFDQERGEIEVGAGVQWPALMDWLDEAQSGRVDRWGIVQKQTGADRLSVGGAVAANIHGRGLALPPIVADVAALTLIGADGEARRCSRTEHADLFRLAVGGYGLVGVVTRVRLRLARRRRMERVVTLVDVDDLMPAFRRRLDAGFVYGDFQFAIDPDGDDFLRRGVFSCYRPVPVEAPLRDGQRALSSADWHRLLTLAHTDKRRAVDAYTAHYLATTGQRYWSDRLQMADYVDGYHRPIDDLLGHQGSEMITELYVPRPRLAAFFAEVRADARRHAVDIVYGTVRLIERDNATVLAWARDPWACVVFNVHVAHTPDGIERAATDFRRLIDRAIEHGGSYYLTYHRFASRRQVERGHPRFAEFLKRKLVFDPEERFQSDWYRHYRRMFADAPSSVPDASPANDPLPPSR